MLKLFEKRIGEHCWDSQFLGSNRLCQGYFKRWQVRHQRYPGNYEKSMKSGKDAKRRQMSPFLREKAKHRNRKNKFMTLAYNLKNSN